MPRIFNNIDNNWAREELIPPYHIYLKIAYHLFHEAIAESELYQNLNTCKVYRV
jgi:hypothetical protein